MAVTINSTVHNLFGITNGVSTLYRTMDEQVEEEDQHKDLDDIVIAGRDQEAHDFNLCKFFEIVERRCLTTKSGNSTNTINILLNGKLLLNRIQNVFDRPLQELPNPQQ